MKCVEIVVIGAGPAGLSASIEVARGGAEVVLIDENEKPGGQLFKQIHKFFGSKEHMAGIRGLDIGYRLLEEAKLSGVQIMLDTIAYGIYEDNIIGIIQNKKATFIKAKKIIIATGGTENSLAFPGWDLPGVMCVGAFQTMINVNRVLPGKNVLMIGSGNVGLIVSYQALQAGANVIAVIEAADKVGGYGVHSSKIRRAGVPIFLSTTIKEASGKGCVEEATIVKLDKTWSHIKGTESKLKVDTICVSVGLTPLAELAWSIGCKFVYIPELGGFIPKHNENMETSIPEIYIAGDISGIEEASSAMEEGKLAGISVLGSLGYLDTKNFNRKKEIIWHRLNELRSGPFGEVRKNFKNTLQQKGVITNEQKYYRAYRNTVIK